MIIAVDGPAGAGKSTVARIIAQRLGFIYIDTGAMYRALTLKALEEEVSTNDSVLLIEMAHSTAIDLVNGEDGTLRIFLDGRDVSGPIREPRVTRFVSDVAKIKGVREVMVDLQRKLGRLRDCVLDGRDIGTVVFPGADRKFYIDADFKERSRRRYKELKEMGQAVTEKDVDNDLSNRDNIDSTRETAPLKKAQDAIYIDTTNLSIEEAANKVLSYIHQPG